MNEADPIRYLLILDGTTNPTLFNQLNTPLAGTVTGIRLRRYFFKGLPVVGDGSPEENKLMLGITGLSLLPIAQASLTSVNRIPLPLSGTSHTIDYTYAIPVPISSSINASDGRIQNLEVDFLNGNSTTKTTAAF